VTILFRVVIVDSAELVRVLFPCGSRAGHDGLIGSNSGGWVNGMRAPAPKQDALFGSSDVDVKARFVSDPDRLGLANVIFPSIVDIRVKVSLAQHTDIKPADLSIHVNSCARGVTSPSRVLANGTGTFQTTLPPGCFVIWAQAGDKVLTRRQQDIGLSATKPEDVDFLLLDR
jgi:hypothetical protein